MPSKGKPATSAASPIAKPAASQAAPAPAKATPSVSKPAAKATASQGKEILKKKPAPSEITAAAAPGPAPAKPAAKTAAKAPAKKAAKSAVKTTLPPPEKPAPPAAPKPLSISDEPQEGEIKHSVFVKIAKQKLLDLKDSLMDSMTGTASETLRNKAEGSEASAFGMHQADAGTDAYDRDFALSLLSQEQDALYEIEEALKRVIAGTYGVCEMSNKRIPQARLEALPFARFTIECQQQYEKEVGPHSGRRQVRSLFGLMGSEDEDEDGEEESSDSDKDS